MTELLKTGEIVEAEVVEANRGGLVVDVGLRGFVPLSQLASVGNLGPTERSVVPDALRDRIGKRLPLKVIEADQRRDRLILSEKAAAQQLRRRRKEEASAQLAEGQVLDGSVASVTTFGLFVDVGAADGLVHRSEITWGKGKGIEPTTLYRPGDSVRVLVTAIDRERGRISLSIKRLEEDPWVRAIHELAVGADLDATVTRVMPYGAFVRVAIGIEGLIHISEIASRRIATPTEVVQPGELVRVRVVAIDPERRRLSLSLRQAAVNVVYATRTDQDANV
jgi:small subunit ribosomal protein S1